MSLREIAILYTRIGSTTFGGGDPTIAALQRELIEKKRWLDQRGFAMANSLARITPGTNVLAFCAASGALIGGWPGAVVAVLGVTLPSAILAVLLTAAYGTWMSEPLVIAAVAGTVAAAIGLMWAGAWLVVRPYFRRRTWLRSALLVAGAFLLSWIGRPPIEVIAAAAVAGYLWTEPAGE